MKAPPVAAAPSSEKTADLNLLGKVDAQAGEARRNENIFITALDNNAQKESNTRLGTTATPLVEVQSGGRYFGAELGLSTSGPVHLSAQRGGKGVHGNVSWTHSNSLFAARSFFQAGGIRPARQNVFGARISAPLWRNGFFSFDGGSDAKHGYVNGNILIPRPEERSCLSADPQICALINRFFRAWPAAVPNVENRSLNTNAAQAIDTWNTTTRLDQALGKHRLSARHTWTDQKVDAFQLVAGQNPDTTTKAHDARLTWSYAPDAKSVWDTTVGFARNRTLLVPEPNAVGPQVQVGTAFEKLGPGSSIPVDRVQNRFRVSSRFQHNFTKHTLSAGVEIARLQFNGREASSNRGNIYFRNDFGNDAITNFRLGLVSRYSFGVGELARGFRRNEQSFFVQDVWRISKTFQASAGLRYQPQRGISEVNHLTTIPFDCDCNNFAPSLGISWQLPRKLGVVRTAYSLQYGEILPATLQQLRWNPPGFQKIENQAPPLLDLLQGVQFEPNGRAIVFHFPRDLQTPYSHQYTFLWEVPLPKSWGKVETAYVGSRTWKLLYMQYLNRAAPVAGIAQTTATINQRRPDPHYYDYREITNSSRAYYDAAKLSYRLQTRSGLTVDSAYWLSKAIDTGASILNIAAGDDANQGQSQSAANVASDLKGVSNFHQKHAFLGRISYQHGTRQRFWKDWRLSTVFVAKSGLPFNVITGSDAPGYGNVDGVSGDRPNLLDPSVLGRTISHPDGATQLLPRTAFAFLQPTDVRGNLGNNAFRRAGFRNLNAAIERRFAMRQDRAILFRAESINALNTPQFAEPIGDLSNPSFGKITNTLNDGRAFRFLLSFEF
ncbi:TonB-dependent receptor domain-containing protein [Bryobacter aggregatus]|uniref:TonB-dependent receptor domain-containing protein n=1 Tax=Bryobacter aggregatus TaxID=360054 RepID=UPI0004E19EBF|nr:TonB-dependent receptor [Bryobacter aggregatus]